MPFLYLFLAHLLGDFVFQPHGLIQWKRQSWKGIFVHVLIHFVLYVLFFSPLLFKTTVVVTLILIAVSHFIIDFLKIYYEKKTRQYVKIFFLDQAIHVLLLLIASFFLENRIDFSIDSFWMGTLLSFPLLLYFIFAIMLTVFVEILRFQFLRGKEQHPRIKFDVPAMAYRLVILSLLFGVAFFIKGF